MDIAAGLSKQVCENLYSQTYFDYLEALDSDDSESVGLIENRLRAMKEIWKLSLCEVILIEAECTHIHTQIKEKQKILSERFEEPEKILN